MRSRALEGWSRWSSRSEGRYLPGCRASHRSVLSGTLRADTEHPAKGNLTPNGAAGAEGFGFGYGRSSASPPLEEAAGVDRRDAGRDDRAGLSEQLLRPTSLMLGTVEAVLEGMPRHEKPSVPCALAGATMIPCRSADPAKDPDHASTTPAGEMDRPPAGGPR